MRVLIASIHYRPEVTAVGPYTAGLAEYLARRGDDVTVVAGLPHHPDWRVAPGARRSLWSAEWMEGVKVVRAAHYVPPRQTAFKRAVYEATFGFTGLLAALGLPRPDAILGIVPTLSGGVLARVAAARFGVPYGILFQDLMGPAARHAGIPGSGRVARVTTAAEAWAVAGATAVAAVSGAFTPYLVSLGVRRDRLSHVRNWSRLATPTMTVHDTRERFGWDDGCVIALHAGNLGYKQGLEQVVETARLAAQRGEPIRFVFAGGGNQSTAIRALSAGLPNVDVIGVQEDGVHASLLAAADVLLLSERATLAAMSLPSKLTSYFAAGRPVVAAVPAGGASATEVEHSGAGLVVPAGSPGALLEALSALRADPDRAARLGKAGLAYAATATSPEACLRRAGAFVDAIAGRSETLEEVAP